MPRFVVPAVFALTVTLSAQSGFFPLKDVKAGMRGVGKTVFSGDRIEDFNVEILGVLDNVGPKESLILARLSGGPLERTGVMQGMSGSPVYIDGKLAGAVAMAFSYAKEPIAGIRPIEDMVGHAGPRGGSGPTPSLASAGKDLLKLFPRPRPAMAGDAALTDIATPLSFSGFTRGTVDAFAPKLRDLGLEPRQGVTSGANIAPGLGDPANLKPGSMISVQLMSGDMSVGADGTVTHIDGNRVYAFGHRFLAVGSTALPFARSEVLTLLPALNTSFKVSSAREWMGTIQYDSETAVSGELGRLPSMAPVSISVSRAGRPVQSYQMRMVSDPLLSPLLLQMAVSSVVEATERAVGAATIRMSGEVNFENAPAPVKIDNIYAVDTGSASEASLAAAIPASYVMQSGYKAMGLKSVSLHIDAFEQKKELAIDTVTLSRRQVRPGETVRLNVTFVGENGAEVTRYADYPMPIGAQPGTLYFTVGDAATTNIADFRQVLSSNPRTAGQVIATVNNLHPNNKAYVRVWRANPSYQLEGADLPDPPPSVALLLSGTQSNPTAVAQNRNAKIAEMTIDVGEVLVSGSKTIQVEVKE